MTTSSRRAAGLARCVAAVILLLALGTAPAVAQQGPSSRPFERLFGEDESGAARLSVSVLQGVDSQSGDVPEARQSAIRQGAFLGIEPTLSYGGEGLGLGGGAVLRRYNDLGGLKVFDSRGHFAARLIGRRTAVNVQGTASYAPYSQFLTLPGMAAAELTNDSATPERAGYLRPVTTFISAFEVARHLSRKLVLSGRYSWQYRHLGPSIDVNDTLADTQMHDVSARLTRQVGRNMMLFAGYGTRLSTEQAQSVPGLRAHDINIGVDRSQQLRFSRRTILQFSTGSSIVDTIQGRRFYLIGNAALRHNFSRTWSAGATGGRGIAYLEGIREPVVSDSVSLSLGGPFGARMGMSINGGFATGDIGLASTSSGFQAYSGSVRLRGLLTRQLTAFGEWVIYEQRFDRRADLPSLFDPRLSRRGLRVGIMMNVPFQSEKPGQRGAR